MIIMPFSVAIDILQELRDLVTGFVILCSTMDRSSIFFSIFFPLSILSGVIILLTSTVKIRKFFKLYRS